MEELIDDEIKEALKLFCKNCSKCNGHFLTSIWDKMPEGCGLEGWLFQQREKEKQKIRRKKEELLDLEVLLKEFPQNEEKIKIAMAEIKNFIEIYSKYGSLDW